MKLPSTSLACMQPRVRGFSLIELAVVLMIIGVLMSGVLLSVSQTTLSARRSAALAQLRDVEEALYGFAESQGRLPCPASATSSGLEAGSAGACTYTHGFVPIVTLGIYGQTNSAGVLVDAWGNPLRYSLVKTAAAGNPDFSNKTSIQSFFSAGTSITSTDMLEVCSDACSAGTVISNIAPAVVMSMGENGATTPTSTNEITNAGTSSIGGFSVHDSSDPLSNNEFISGTYSEENFDDQLVWLSPYVLFNRMVSAGKLP